MVPSSSSTLVRSFLGRCARAQRHRYTNRTLMVGMLLGASVALLSVQALSTLERFDSSRTQHQFFEDTSSWSKEERLSRMYKALNPFITQESHHSLEGKNGAPGSLPEQAHPHQAFIESLNIKPNDTVSEIAQKALESDRFIALALMVENIPERPYVDAAGVNVGAGYCVTKRLAALGKEKVAADLAFAGFSEAHIKDLLSQKKEAQLSHIHVTKAQAISLLMITKPEYEQMAKKAIGAPFFDALKPEKQDTLTYLTYNTGGLHTFKKLVQAIRSAQPQAALQEMTPRWKSENGKWNLNHRLRAWAQASFLGKPLEVAIQDPHAFEKQFAHKKGERAFLQENEDLIAQKAKEQRSLFKKHIPQEFQKVANTAPKKELHTPKKKGTAQSSSGQKSTVSMSSKLSEQRALKAKQKVDASSKSAPKA